MKREPGPSVIRSALPIASSVSCIGFTLAGLRRMRWIGERLSGNPSLTFHHVPSFNTACNTTLVGVDGKIRAAGRKDVRRMLDGFGEVAGQVVRAVRNKFPRLWPFSPLPASKRY